MTVPLLLVLEPLLAENSLFFGHCCTWTRTLHPWLKRTACHTPTPLIALIIILVPWRNSSLEFILVSGSRCDILTPSLAFLLCGLKKIPVWIISKCSNISISILPSCFSIICFQRGFSFAFFSQSVRCSTPHQAQNKIWHIVILNKVDTTDGCPIGPGSTLQKEVQSWCD